MATPRAPFEAAWCSRLDATASSHTGGAGEPSQTRPRSRDLGRRWSRAPVVRVRGSSGARRRMAGSRRVPGVHSFGLCTLTLRELAWPRSSPSSGGRRTRSVRSGAREGRGFARVRRAAPLRMSRGARGASRRWRLPGLSYARLLTTRRLRLRCRRTMRARCAKPTVCRNLAALLAPQCVQARAAGGSRGRLGTRASEASMGIACERARGLRMSEVAAHCLSLLALGP